MLKSKIYTLLLSITLFLFIFQDFITTILPIFKFYDEVFIVLAIPIFILKRSTKFIISMKRNTKNMIIMLSIFILLGILSYLLNSKQPIIVLYSDMLLNLKFFLAIYIGYSLTKNINLDNRILTYMVKLITFLLFILLITNFIHPIFENQELRFGIPIPKLFYSHSGYLAASGTLLLVITYKLYNCMKRPHIWMIMQLFIIFVTFRYKAMATAVVCSLIFIIVVKHRSRLKWYHLVIVAIAVLLIAWDQIDIYYFSKSINNARGKLTYTSISISKDMFPLGVGFGSYASYFSKVYYSTIYFDYNLDRIWGLSPSYPSFISDTFWPMILGQTGMFGLLSYLGALIFLLKSIFKLYHYDKYSYISGICIFAYLMLESTSSAAFVSPSAVPFGLWLGTLFSNQFKIRKGTVYERKL